MKTLITASLIAFASLGTVSVQAAGDHAGHAMAALAAASAEMQMVDGQVKKVDKAAGKVTLSHGPLTNLNMPAMTMVFCVKEAAWLDQMQSGGKIRFVADSIDGTLTIVRYEAAK